MSIDTTHPDQEASVTTSHDVNGLARDGTYPAMTADELRTHLLAAHGLDAAYVDEDEPTSPPNPLHVLDYLESIHFDDHSCADEEGHDPHAGPEDDEGPETHYCPAHGMQEITAHRATPGPDPYDVASLTCGDDVVALSSDPRDHFVLDSRFQG